MDGFRDTVKDWLKDFVKALIFFLILQTYFIQGFVIEGACMEPQLHTNEKILVNKLLYYFFPPRTGDVVVFTFPHDANKDFIKRVVGVPGDTLEISDGYLFRNGRKLPEKYVNEYVFGSYGPINIPDGKVCVMGDNRNNSHDSRAWGLLDVQTIKGRAELKFWPMSAIGLIHSYSE
ncbi:MAG: signal peptidase I [Candidatus Riflebacteria bacterium]|nr:signal peptidase I [Candidatus Riflebacteria bacterium]